MKNLLVIDGQGGNIGRMLIEKIKKQTNDSFITAIGTNSIATANMLKGGADQAATGENPLTVAARQADMIIGPIGIVIADSLLGEVTSGMALAVGKSLAKKVLLPVNKCNNLVAGIPDLSVAKVVEDAVRLVETEL